jgi:hypothetical protein
LISLKAPSEGRTDNDAMIRDSTVAALLDRRFASNSMKREAATVLLDLCRDGLNDEQIAAAVENAEARLPSELIKEIRTVAAEIGIDLR